MLDSTLSRQSALQQKQQSVQVQQAPGHARRHVTQHSERDNELEPELEDDDDSDTDLQLVQQQAEFYDSEADDKDQAWMQKQRQGRRSDAILSCPGCLTTVCIDCQRHEYYTTRYRAMFVPNCRSLHTSAANLQQLTRSPS